MIRVFLTDLAWLVCAIEATVPVLWLMVHPFASLWRKMRRRLPWVGLIWLALWIVSLRVSAPWRHHLLYNSGWSWLAAVPFWVIAARLLAPALRNFGFRRLVGQVELDAGAVDTPPSPDSRLVTEGIHGRLRHPVYVAHFCLMLGWSIGACSLACWSLTAFAAVAGLAMIRLEECELEQRFGEAFREYRRRVPMLVPRRRG